MPQQRPQGPLAMDPMAAPPRTSVQRDSTSSAASDAFDLWSRPQSPALPQHQQQQTRLASPVPQQMMSGWRQSIPAPHSPEPDSHRKILPSARAQQQPLPESLQQPQHFPGSVPPARARAHTTESLPPNFAAYQDLYQGGQEATPAPARVRLDTADALPHFAASPNPQRVRLETADTTATMPAFNLSPSPQPQGGWNGPGFESERTQRIRNGGNGASNRHLRANTVDAGGCNALPTPRMANKSPAIAAGERKQLMSQAPPLPLDGTLPKEPRHVGFSDVGNGEGLINNHDGEGSVVFDNLESHGDKESGNMTELYMEDKVKSPTVKAGRKGIELTATNDVFERIIASSAARDEDEASDVSSLSDTVWSRKQQQQAGAKGSLAPTSGVTSAMASLWKRRNLRLKSRYAHQYDAPDHRDTASTAATSIGHSAGRSIGHSAGRSVDQNSQTLETIDHSLEHRLFENGAYGRRRASRPAMTGRGSSEGTPPTSGAFVPSPLCAEVYQERSRQRLGGAGHRRRWTAMEPGNLNGHYRRSTSNGSDYGSVSSIQGSWLLPTSATPPRTPLTENTPEPHEDLIDINEDEPVDPFSGLIGMPASIGCESSVVSDGDGGSYSGMNVFGMARSVTSFVQSPAASPVDTVPPGEETSASSSKPTPGRRPSWRSKSSTFDDFDPLVEAEILQTHSMASVGSPLRPSTMPPRHHRDDPLLSRSRYRGPSQMQNKTKNKLVRHQRSSSLGGDGIGGSACMFGSIALLETVHSGGVPSGASVDALLTPGSVAEEETKASPSSPGEPTNLDKEAAGECDNSSCGSFAEEFNRAEGKRKVVKNEIKHMFEKVLVGKAGRRLLGRGAEEAEMKRAGGCLT